MGPNTLKDAFRRFSRKTADAVGSPAIFVAAILLVAIWFITGPIFHYSDTWQLIINTATTIVTFLMVFLIQNTQNRDSLSIHLKLDELIRSLKTARNSMIDLDALRDDELQTLQQEFQELCHRRGLAKSSVDPNCPPDPPGPAQPGAATADVNRPARES